MTRPVARLSKREYDSRVLGVDVKRKVHRGSAVTSFDSVDASRKSGPEGSLDLVVEVHDTPIVDRTILFFACSEGSAGATYTVAMRYTSDNEPQLETIAEVTVV